MVAEKTPPAPPPERAPVTDWKTDYEIFDAGYIKDPFPVWDEIRSSECPVAHSDRHLGSWMPTRYEDLFAIAQDIQHFSSRDVLVAPFGVEQGYEPTAEEEQFAEVSAPPITADPPLHTWTRKLLLPPFSIRSVEKWEQMTRDHCNDLIDAFIEKGECDGAIDYAQQIPPYVIAAMLGVPKEMVPTFTEWVRDVLEQGFANPEGAAQARMQMLTFLWSHIQDRRANPGDDLISYLAQAEVDGAPIPDQHILGTGFLIVVAGIDTTWSSIGSALWHLAQNPGDRQHIINHPEMLSTAIEELLRAYSPVTMARYVAEEVDYKGCPMKEGERVVMNFPAANRDPEKFMDADKVVIDRAKNPHIAFGAGIHRCAGSNLARMEMRVSVQEFLRRIPDFELADPENVTWAGGQVRGPRSMRVKFPAGGKA
jgi:cytochrome P450